MQTKMTLKLNDPTDEKTSIIVVHRNNPGFMNLCLQSISLMSENNNYEVVIVDDASDDLEAINFIEGLKTQDYKVIVNEKQSYWSKSANAGAKAADPDSKYYIFMHHDVVVLNPNWIDLLVASTLDNNSGMVGVSFDGYNFDGYSSESERIPFVEEWCVLISKECFLNCKGFNEKLPQVGHAFLFTLLANSQGYSPQITSFANIVHHFRIGSVDANDMEKFFEEVSTLLPVLMREIQSLSIT